MFIFLFENNGFFSRKFDVWSSKVTNIQIFNKFCKKKIWTKKKKNIPLLVIGATVAVACISFTLLDVIFDAVLVVVANPNIGVGVTYEKNT